MEETRSIKIVGRYSVGQANPEDCQTCHNATWATTLIDGICLDCFIAYEKSVYAIQILNCKHEWGICPEAREDSVCIHCGILYSYLPIDISGGTHDTE
jgi:hypothetical protein